MSKAWLFPTNGNYLAVTRLTDESGAMPTVYMITACSYFQRKRNWRSAKWAEVKSGMAAGRRVSHDGQTFLAAEHGG